MAHVTTSLSLASPPWFLESSASHHVTIDLNNLDLHAPYDGPDDVVIGDGTGLHITHSGSTSLSIPSHSFTLQNVLCVPNMKRNLISISQFFKTNKTLVEFLSSSFHVKDLQTGAILIHGCTKDGVYELLTKPSTSIIAFSGVKASHSDWHHRLGHPSEPVLRHLVSHYKLHIVSALSSSFHRKDIFVIKVLSYLSHNPPLCLLLHCKLSFLIYGHLLFNRLTTSNIKLSLLITSLIISGSTHSNVSSMSVSFFPASNHLLKFSSNGKLLPFTRIMEVNTKVCPPF